MALDDKRRKVLTEYIMLVCQDEKMKAMCGERIPFYGIEQRRIDLHYTICDLYDLDRIESKSILSFLDEQLGFDYSDDMSNADFERMVNKLDALLVESNK